VWLQGRAIGGGLGPEQWRHPGNLARARTTSPGNSYITLKKKSQHRWNYIEMDIVSIFIEAHNTMCRFTKQGEKTKLLLSHFYHHHIEEVFELYFIVSCTYTWKLSTFHPPGARVDNVVFSPLNSSRGVNGETVFKKNKQGYRKADASCLGVLGQQGSELGLPLDLLVDGVQHQELWTCWKGVV
jgi:hypothetical protein